MPTAAPNRGRRGALYSIAPPRELATENGLGGKNFTDPVFIHAGTELMAVKDFEA
jgi:hypothetical protein